MDRQQAILRYEREKKNQEYREHEEVLLALRSILKTPEGLTLFSYLFKNYEVMTAPAQGMQGLDLHEYLGFLRAGNEFYKLTCEADSEIAGQILAKKERERYADKYHLYRIENGLYDDTNESDS